LTTYDDFKNSFIVKMKSFSQLTILTIGIIETLAGDCGAPVAPEGK
jgi:hypothetical protein